MTDLELDDARNRRNTAMRRVANFTTHAIVALSPADRQAVDRLSAEFRALDRAVVEELRRRDRPARLGTVVLHLTADRMHYVELDPATGAFLHAGEPAAPRSILYGYGRRSA